jgi:hypothetical protein
MRESRESLAAQLGGEGVPDDLGRRCVSRETARRLFAERAALEARQREVQERCDAEFASDLRILSARTRLGQG